jgi:predicted dehydrogenase
MEVRWGFIGGGDVTRWRSSPEGAFTQEGSRVVAVARTDIVRAKAYAEAHAIPKAYASVKDLCADPEVDAVYICTPHHLHRQHTLAAIRMGKHVLCEKPMANSIQECLAMAEAADRTGVILAIAYYRRLYPLIEKLREVLASGQLGTPTSAQVVKHGYFVPVRETLVVDRRSQWRTNLAQGGGGTLNETGCHRLDLLLYLFGPVRSVSAEVARFEAWYDGEDQASVTLRFVKGVIAQMDQSWCSRTPRDHFAVDGTHGSVVIEDLEADRLQLRIGDATEDIVVEARPRATHRALVADFCRALRSGGSVRCSGWEGMQATQVIEHAYQAARERRTVDVPAPFRVRANVG